jgi:heterotetrameric sarcosine oxidase gamma subunit
VRLSAQSTLGAPFGSASRTAGLPDSSCAFLERADVGCVLLTAAVDMSEIVTSASAATGIDLPLAPGAIKRYEGRLALWLSPRSWLIHCSINEENAIATDVNEAFPSKLVHATPFTDHVCWLELCGRQSASLLKQGTFISLERNGLSIGHSKRTQITGIPVVIVREAEAVWLLGVERSRARFFADWVTASARCVD